MVVVPSGSAQIGSKGGDKDEKPVHRVSFGRSFAVGKYEVTRGQYEVFVKATGRSDSLGCYDKDKSTGKWVKSSARTWKHPGYSQTGKHPVACISWNDAKAYVSWLSRKTGQRYRLLSEAEWEYVARAGTTSAFHFGRTISTNKSNYDGNYVYSGGPKGVYREKSMPVGSFPANSFGLHDVHGNIWEWTEDCFHDSYNGAPTDGRAWTSGGKCGTRIIRGGSWYNSPNSLRSANRKGMSVSDRFMSFGFRVARSL
jgi:formylglycine-generating enzyme required for sulfatase activity